MHRQQTQAQVEPEGAEYLAKLRQLVDMVAAVKLPVDLRKAKRRNELGYVVMYAIVLDKQSTSEKLTNLVGLLS